MVWSNIIGLLGSFADSATIGKIVGAGMFAGHVINKQSDANRDSKLLRERKQLNSEALSYKENELYRQESTANSAISNKASAGNTYGGLGSDALQKNELRGRVSNEIAQAENQNNYNNKLIDEQIHKNDNAGISAGISDLEKMFGGKLSEFVSRSFSGGK